MTLFHLTSYNICSQWFENHKFVLQSFHFFYCRMSLSLWKKNLEREMTLHLLFLLTIANTYRYSILLAPFDVQHTGTTKPTKWITVRHKCTEGFLLIIAPLSIFTVCIDFFYDLNPYCLCFSLHRDFRWCQHCSEF